MPGRPIARHHWLHLAFARAISPSAAGVICMSWEIKFSDPRHERRRRILLTLLLLAVPLAFALGWGTLSYLRPVTDAHELQVLISEKDQELEFLRQRLAVVGSSEKVAQQAIEQNRRTIKLLEEQIFKLQQDVAFYKGVLAPGSRREGLRIRAFELQATEDPQRFRYKLLLSRVGTAEEPLEGTLSITLQGKLGGKDKNLSLASVSDEFSGNKTPFPSSIFSLYLMPVVLPSCNCHRASCPLRSRSRLRFRGTSPWFVHSNG